MHNNVTIHRNQNRDINTPFTAYLSLSEHTKKSKRDSKKEEKRKKKRTWISERCALRATRWDSFLIWRRSPAKRATPGEAEEGAEDTSETDARANSCCFLFCAAESSIIAPPSNINLNLNNTTLVWLYWFDFFPI